MEPYILEAMQYFTVEDWTKLDGSEQMKYGRILYIYQACIHLGIYVVTPDFMLQTNKSISSKCKYCKTTYASEEDITKHMKTCKKRLEFLNKKKKYPCEKCSYSTDHLGRLKLHNITHTKEKKFVCKFCNKAFSQKMGINKHIRNIHSNKEKSFTCDKCPYKTYNKSNLGRHLRTHSIVKTFICEFCQKGFNQKTDLNLHLFKHTNEEKPFKCETCEKSFLTHPTLMRHIKVVHFKVKPFKCDQCDFSSSNKTNLRRHTNTHFNEELCKCTICGFQALTVNHMNFHIENEHGKSYL